MIDAGWNGEGLDTSNLTLIVPKRRSLIGVRASLRRLSKSFDEYDIVLLMAAIRAIKVTHGSKKATDIASMLAHRMLCEEIARLYGITYKFPNQLHKTVRKLRNGKPYLVNLCVLLPPLKTIVMPPKYQTGDNK